MSKQFNLSQPFADGSVKVTGADAGEVVKLYPLDWNTFKKAQAERNAAEDRAEASIACRQVGPISFPAPLKAQEEIFSERMSILFKKLRVVRMVDRSRNTLVYLTYSERVVEGSPQNSVTAVAVDRATPIPVK